MEGGKGEEGCKRRSGSSKAATPSDKEHHPQAAHCHWHLAGLRCRENPQVLNTFPIL